MECNPALSVIALLHRFLDPCVAELLTTREPSTDSVEPSSDAMQKVYAPPRVTRNWPEKVAAKLVLGVPGTNAVNAAAVRASTKLM